MFSYSRHTIPPLATVWDCRWWRVAHSLCSILLVTPDSSNHFNSINSILKSIKDLSWSIILWLGAYVYSSNHFNSINSILKSIKDLSWSIILWLGAYVYSSNHFNSINSILKSIKDLSWSIIPRVHNIGRGGDRVSYYTIGCTNA